MRARIRRLLHEADPGRKEVLFWAAFIAALALAVLLVGLAVS